MAGTMNGTSGLRHSLPLRRLFPAMRKPSPAYCAIMVVEFAPMPELFADSCIKENPRNPSWIAGVVW